MLAINPSPTFVSRLTIVNNTPFDYGVSMTDAHHDGWTALVTAKAQSSTDVNQVIDQGDTWTFHFYGQGIDAGEVSVARSDLAVSDWHLTIPDAVSKRLSDAGAPSSSTTS
jgi:hypothetical protein